MENYISTSRTHVNDLPLDILAIVFEYAVERYHHADNELQELPYSPPMASRAPLNLAGVCCSWRNFTISLPSLWSRIRAERQELSRPSPAILQLFLERSRTMPLHLIIKTNNRGTGAHDKYEEEALDTFKAHIQRWKTLSISGDANLLGQLAKFFDEGENLPPLEALEINYMGSISPTLDDKIFSYVSKIPSLRGLFLTIAHRERFSSYIPWSQLHIVSCRNTSTSSYASCLELLLKCLSAQTFTFRGGLPSLSSRNLLQDLHITLSSLTALTLSSSCDPLGILHHCIFPSLRTLDIEIPRNAVPAINPISHNAATLESFFVASNAPLTLLIIRADFTFTSKHFVSFLSSPRVRSIPRVELWAPSANSMMLHIIDSLQDAGTLFPRLMLWGHRKTIPFGRVFQGVIVGWIDNESDIRDLQEAGDFWYWYREGRVTFDRPVVYQ
ncbi:hypothetical protein GALMADRAFT_253060 [Galerina marginata CBS 339.88]|uniref:F-box domain-containing protein n=1 Tax=Galerina marginata (strain CBS 339.88) TaxID=685588 RepID=A0A067SMS0_GALM3|nr:hypothetical protein GALMADRAFT_253060 [Galerina marginata CBS 339.88]